MAIPKEIAFAEKKTARPKLKSFKLGYDIRTQLELKSMLIPAVLFIFLFDFTPLFGLLMAFKDFEPVMGVKGIFTADWNNFAHFKRIFVNNFQLWPMVRNTLGINLLGAAVSIPCTLLFALLLNEIRSTRFKSLVQTVTYLPHFLSWVIFGGLFITLLNTDGIVNFLLMKLHLIDKPLQFLADPKYFWGVAIGTGLLKDIGWGAILYLAAMAGVDQSLYEAAAIDGAGRFKRMLHITIPGILPTLMVMIIFAVSGMLNNNFTQIYVLQNSLNLPTSQVIDTYVYQTGLLNFQFSSATAIGLMKSVFALLLLFGANTLSKKITKTGLF